MYEGIIETLIKLFAIITNYRHSEAFRIDSALVESYLKENFSKEMSDKYLLLYQDNVDYFHEKHTEILYGNDRNGEKLINRDYLDEICNGIVELFNLEARFMMVVQLLNFIKKVDGVKRQDLKMVNLVANGLKINAQEYDNLFQFYLYSIEKVKDKSCLFVVNGNGTYRDSNIKYLYRENQNIELELIRIGSINALFFKYWGPRNMYLNGHRLVQKRLYFFPPGGILRTSRIIPIYYSSIMSRFIRQEGKPGIVYNADNIEYRFSRKVYGVHPFSFQERSGDLVGILGGSGVGKTTLLNVLNGKLKPNKGTITINGYDLHDTKNDNYLKGVIGYVPQDDLLLEDLTVYKNLEFNARFCFGNMDDEQIGKIISQTLIDFDLVEARDLVVGSPLKKILSGGQRKRLNIALELMREPSILFIDEPTSGLSSADSEKVMYLLKRQCLKGKLVIVNIHQPSSDIYKLFDRMIVMDKGGRFVFFGNPMEAVTHFKREANYVNPDESECQSCGNVKTEQPLRIIEERMVDPFGKSIRRRKIVPEEWYLKYKEKVEPRVVGYMNDNPAGEVEFPPNYFKTPKWFEQLKLFLKRDFSSKKSNHQYLSIALLEAPFLAIILGFFSKYAPMNEYHFGSNDNIPSFLFMSVVVVLFIGLSISAEEIFKDRKILKREEFLDLSRGAYISSKILMLFAISAIQVLSFVLIGYFMLDFSGLTFSNWAILFTTACFANMLGLNLSAGLNSVVSIYILIPLILVPQLLLSGVIVDFNKMHPSISCSTETPLIGDLMTSRWAYEALAVNEFKNNDFRKRIFELERVKNECDFKAFYWLDELGQQLDNYDEYLGKDDTIKSQSVRVLLENSFASLFVDLMLSTDSTQLMINFLGNDQFNSEAKQLLHSYLAEAKSIYHRQYSVAAKRLDNAYTSIIKDFHGDKAAVVAYRNRYVNKKLETVLRDSYSLQRTVVENNRIYQSDEPIFRKPAYTNGRAHFYAHYKQIGKVKIDTVLFNVLVIWLFSFLLMVSLYFDLLRKVIEYIEKWQLLQLSKLRDRIFYNPMAFMKGKKD